MIKEDKPRNYTWTVLALLLIIVVGVNLLTRQRWMQCESSTVGVTVRLRHVMLTASNKLVLCSDSSLPLTSLLHTLSASNPTTTQTRSLRTTTDVVPPVCSSVTPLRPN